MGPTEEAMALARHLASKYAELATVDLYALAYEIMEWEESWMESHPESAE